MDFRFSNIKLNKNCVKSFFGNNERERDKYQIIQLHGIERLFAKKNVLLSDNNSKKFLTSCWLFLDVYDDAVTYPQVMLCCR